MPTESSTCFGLVINEVGGKGCLGVGVEGAEGYFLCIQNVSGLMFKRKLLPLIIKLVVILNHLGVMHLWSPQKNCDLLPPTSTKKWTIDQLLFKKAFENTWRILRHPFPLFHVHVINVWSLTCLLLCFFRSRKNYDPAVWTKQANHKNIA